MGELKVLKLKDGDDVLESLKDFALKNNITQAYIKEAEGKIKDFEISSFAGRGSIENIKDRHSAEVIAINGQIRGSGERLSIDLKVSLARPGLSAISGVLLTAKVAESLEIAVQKSDVGKIIYA